MNEPNKSLGEFLKEKRSKLDPSVFGFQKRRRRTPGLRREEVAQLSNISPTWYTWLEQSRGGSPSKEVLSRVANALLLTEHEKEYLFILAFGHPPETTLTVSNEITPRPQRVLDQFGQCPAIIKTVMWDVVAWNDAALKILNDYASMEPKERNTLRYMFTNPQAKKIQKDWASVAQFIVSTFRADVTRIGISSEIEEFIHELSTKSDDFSILWRSHEVTGHGGGIKTLLHPEIGQLELEFSTFIIEGRADLNMLIFNPVDDKTKTIIAEYINAA